MTRLLLLCYCVFCVRSYCVRLGVIVLLCILCVEYSGNIIVLCIPRHPVLWTLTHATYIYVYHVMYFWVCCILRAGPLCCIVYFEGCCIVEYCVFWVLEAENNSRLTRRGNWARPCARFRLWLIIITVIIIIAILMMKKVKHSFDFWHLKSLPGKGNKQEKWVSLYEKAGRPVAAFVCLGGGSLCNLLDSRIQSARLIIIFTTCCTDSGNSEKTSITLYVFLCRENWT